MSNDQSKRIDDVLSGRGSLDPDQQFSILSLCLEDLLSRVDPSNAEMIAKVKALSEADMAKLAEKVGEALYGAFSEALEMIAFTRFGLELSKVPEDDEDILGDIERYDALFDDDGPEPDIESSFRVEDSSRDGDKQ